MLENKQLAECLANASTLRPQGCLDRVLNAKTMGKDADAKAKGRLCGTFRCSCGPSTASVNVNFNQGAWVSNADHTASLLHNARPCPSCCGTRDLAGLTAGTCPMQVPRPQHERIRTVGPMDLSAYRLLTQRGNLLLLCHHAPSLSLQSALLYM